MADITLTASMRSNLLSLQNTQSLMDMTQERLSTGNKVNSAIDNPSSYYTAQSLNNRAGDLSALLDSMGQAIQTIKAANEGIESVTSFVEQAKAVATTALDTGDLDQVTASQKQFGEILDQIDKLAKDSGYKGVNILQGDDLTVVFNEDRSSDIKIAGDHADSKSLGIDKPTDWNTPNAALTAAKTAETEFNAKTYTVPKYVATGDGASANTKVTIEGVAKTGADFDTTISTSYDDDTTVTSSGKTVGALKDEYKTAVTTAVGTNTGEFADLAAKNAAIEAARTAYENAAKELYDAEKTKVADDLRTAESATIKENKAKIRSSIEQIDGAINTLRSMASTFGNNFSIVQTREDFTESLINVLTEGADKLTLADMNEESANMLALQTRQQLAINSLSLASQAAQSVLKLF